VVLLCVCPQDCDARHCRSTAAWFLCAGFCRIRPCLCIRSSAVPGSHSRVPPSHASSCAAAAASGGSGGSSAAAALMHRELAFFERVKARLRNRDMYQEFLKCLNIFSQEIIGRAELQSPGEPEPLLSPLSAWVCELH